MNPRKYLHQFWTEEENIVLSQMYFNSTPSDILDKIPNRTWDAIKLHAAKLGLNKNKYFQHHSDKIKFLLDETPLAYYWIGFIMADGHIHDSKRLVIGLHHRDEQHLQKLGNLLEIPITQRKSQSWARYLSIQDSFVIPKLAEKFQISSRKTYEPCDISQIVNPDLFLAWLTGFIDGDGSIGKQTGSRKDPRITIKCHASWLENFKIIHSFLVHRYQYQLPIPYINKLGYVELYISKTPVIKSLKQDITTLNIPFLERKWNRINLNYQTRYEFSEICYQQIINKFQEGYSGKEIIEILNLKPGRVYAAIKKFMKLTI